MKLSIDGGFTCPNRDGKVGSRGCIFCGEEGSGEFAGSRLDPIRVQIENQKVFYLGSGIRISSLSTFKTLLIPMPL